MNVLDLDFTKVFAPSKINNTIDKFKKKKELIGITALFIILTIILMKRFFAPKDFIPNDEHWTYDVKKDEVNKKLYLFYAGSWCRHSTKAFDFWRKLQDNYKKYNDKYDKVTGVKNTMIKKYKEATNLERKYGLHNEGIEGDSEIQPGYFEHHKFYDLLKDKKIEIQNPILIDKFNSPVKFSTLGNIEQTLIDKKDNDFEEVSKFIKNNYDIVLDSYPMIFLEIPRGKNGRNTIEFDAELTFANLYEFMRSI